MSKVERMSRLTARMLASHSPDRLWGMLRIALENQDSARIQLVAVALSYRTQFSASSIMYAVCNSQMRHELSSDMRACRALWRVC